MPGNYRTLLTATSSPRALLRNRSGAGLVEFGILAGLIAVVAIVSITQTGDKVAAMFGGATAAFEGSGVSGDPAGPSTEVDTAPEIALFVRAAGPTKISSGTDIIADIAPETQAGDMLVAIIRHRDTLTAPPGWDLAITQKGHQGYDQWLSVLTKPYDPADGVTYTFQQATSQAYSSHILSIDGTDPAVASVAGISGNTIEHKTPAFATADPMGLVIGANAEVYALNNGPVSVAADPGWALTTPGSIEQNRLFVAWRDTAIDTPGIYVPGVEFDESRNNSSYNLWAGVTVQMTPGGRAAEPESFGAYAADVDPSTWLILTEAADTATMSGEDGVLGKGGNDVITGTKGSETFIAGPGDDNLSGLEGGDTYVFTPGDGKDRITDKDYSSSNIDRLELRDIAPGDAAFINTGTDLEIRMGADMVTLRGQDANTSGTQNHIEQVLFKHGGTETLLANHQAIRDKADQDGKATGRVNGFYYTDNYFHSIAEDGSYEISDFSYTNSEIDTLTFLDANPDQTSFIINQTNLVITADNGAGAADTITIFKQDDSSPYSFVERYVFADGTTLDHQGMRNKAADDAKATGTVDGTHYAEQYFHTAAVDGDYKIWEFSYKSDEIDSLFFTDANPDQTSFVISGGDLNVTVDIGDGSPDLVKINDQDDTSSFTFIENFIFADGTTLDQQGMRNKAADDAKKTGTVDGTHFAEQYFHNAAVDGSYKIWEFSYNTNEVDSLTFQDATIDQVEFRILDGDLVATVDVGDGTPDVVKINDQDDSRTFPIVETYTFADGTTLDFQAALNKAAHDAKKYGTIDGTHWAEQYTHSVATDGSYSIKDFSYFSNQPDTLTFTDASTSDVVITRDGDNAVISVGGDTITLIGQLGSSSLSQIETFVFQGGGTTTTWTKDDFAAAVSP